MPKLRLIGLTLLALSATAVSHAEETRYVSDELNTWVRSGPGDHYRLVGTVNAGEEVTLLQTDANTNYAQVKDSSGRTAWIPFSWMTNSAPSSCNGLCMAVACWGLACCSVWYCRT